MKSEKINFASNLKTNIRRRLIAGLLVILPVYVTYFIIKFLIELIGGILSPIAKKVITLLGGTPPGNVVEGFIVTTIAFILVFAAFYFIGVFATNFFGKLILGYFEAIVHKMPIIKNVYTSSKKLLSLVSFPGRKAFKRVVIVEYLILAKNKSSVNIQ